MQKRLQPLGNSLALVVEKPILKMLGIGRETLLQVTTDGRRLVVEPIYDASPEKAAAPVALELDALAVFLELVNTHMMTAELFGRLHHNSNRLLRYRGWLESGCGQTANEEELATMARLQVVLERLRSGESWPDAIAAAHAASPIASIDASIGA